MPWLQLKLRTRKEFADALSDRLSDLGADAVTYVVIRRASAAVSDE